MTEQNKVNCTIDWETAGNITNIVLNETRTSLREQLDDFYNEKEGAWLHQEDVILFEKVIRSVDFLLTNWYGNGK